MRWDAKPDRGSTALRVELAEGRVEPIEGLIRQAPHLAQRMRGRDPVFCGDVREQGSGGFLLAAHPLSAVALFSRIWLAFSAGS